MAKRGGGGYDLGPLSRLCLIPFGLRLFEAHSQDIRSSFPSRLENHGSNVWFQYAPEGVNYLQIKVQLNPFDSAQKNKSP
jgi:hypothetical protein